MQPQPNILSSDILPVEDLRNMLRHIESLPLTMHLLLSSDDALHFYQFLKTHVLIAEGQFLIDVPIQNRAHSKYMMFSIYQFCIVTYQPNTKLTTGT